MPTASPCGTTARRIATPDLIPADPGNGYFAAANELLRPGDQIIANLPREGRPIVINLMVTAVDAAGAVAVAPIDSGGLPAPLRRAATASAAA
jgi:hypothetical protein